MRKGDKVWLVDPVTFVPIPMTVFQMADDDSQVILRDTRGVHHARYINTETVDIFSVFLTEWSACQLARLHLESLLRDNEAAREAHLTYVGRFSGTERRLILESLERNNTDPKILKQIKSKFQET